MSELEPILIAFVKQNKLQFSTNSFKDILSKAGSRPVSVVSISYPVKEQRDEILNECLKYFERFNINRDNRTYYWKSRSNSDTKGIYLWPEPIIVKKSGQEVAIILSETNATIEEKCVTRDDLMLFALNCVLCSTLISSVANNISNDFIQLMQLFSKYAKGGIGSDLKDSFLSIVLMVREWKNSNRYPFGYHDVSTCPPIGNTMNNYRKDILNLENGEFAFGNQYFVDSYQKIGFCLLPGKDTELIDVNSNVVSKFGDVWGQTISRLFHPSIVSIKRLNHQKFNGQQLVTLFERISELMAEVNDNSNETADEFRTRLRNVTALSNGINYYRLRIDKLTQMGKPLTETQLNEVHKETRDQAFSLFEKIKQQKGPRDHFYELFDSELDNIWNLYQQLNRLRHENIQKPNEELIVENKNQFFGQQNDLDLEISRLTGISLDGITNAVHSTIGTN